MDKYKLANLISYITMLANRGGGCLASIEIEEIEKIIQNNQAPQLVFVNYTLIDELLQLMAAKENKIEAIKTYRGITGVGLKEAKDAVERYW